MKLRCQIAITVTPEEYEIIEELCKRGYSKVGIFRRGVKEIEQELKSLDTQA